MAIVKDWFLAGLGMVLAVVGGLGEANHHLVTGSVAVVIGLTGWVFFSGSAAWVEGFDASGFPSTDPGHSPGAVEEL